jgi:hypothetical protein
MKRINMIAKVNYVPGSIPSVSLAGVIQIAIAGKRGIEKFFGVGAVPRGSAGRQVHKGPLVDGPWAYAYGMPVCIVADPAARARDKQERDDALRVEAGDEIEIDRVIYRVEIERGEYVNFVKVEA